MVDMEVKLDDREYQQALARLTGKEAQRLEKKALNAAANVIKVQARKNLREETERSRSKRYNAMKGYNLKYNRKGIVTGVMSLEEGIRTKFHKEGEEAGGPFSKVNIMKDFRLRFFEGGTKERTTRKGYDRGHMTATNFFTKAKRESMAAAEDKMDEIIMSGLRSIWVARVSQ